ncbi:MAG TPA: lysine 5,6-aminomutase subunit alpha, partial [Clostridia bacterium]|nr:lysine 5,6-aminomutase subunit alpha [Clostridia bacterium]
MQSKLNLNRSLVDKARASAAAIAEDTQRFIDVHTTVTVERAVCRLLGIDGVNEMDVPLPNV